MTSDYEVPGLFLDVRCEATLVVYQVRVFEALLGHAVVFLAAPLYQLVWSPSDHVVVSNGARSGCFWLESAFLQLFKLALFFRGHVAVW